MANLNLGRIIGAGVFTTTVESSASVAISTVSPSTVAPLVGDAIIFANGDIRNVTAVSNGTATCGGVVANIKGVNGEDGVDATHSWNGTTLTVTSASGSSSADLKGAKGDDGVDATHSWNGTTLTVTSASGSSSADLKGAKGDKGDKGDPFAIYKTYASVAAMNADLANVPEGKFVMISTGNVEDEDNAKLYVRDASAFAYITDLSGAQGIKGDAGDDGVSVESVAQTTTSTADDGDNVFTVTLSNGTKSTFTVQNGSKGSKGDTGDKGDTPVLSINENGELVVTYESYQPDGGDSGTDGGDSGTGGDDSGTTSYAYTCSCCGHQSNNESDFVYVDGANSICNQCN